MQTFCTPQISGLLPERSSLSMLNLDSQTVGAARTEKPASVPGYSFLILLYNRRNLCIIIKRACYNHQGVLHYLFYLKKAIQIKT